MLINNCCKSIYPTLINTIIIGVYYLILLLGFPILLILGMTTLITVFYASEANDAHESKT